MAILHMVNRTNLDVVKHFISFNDSVLFLKNSLANIEQLNLDVENRFVLSDDFKDALIAKNLSKLQKHLKISSISYADLVNLTLKYDKTILWN